jgi:putative phosphoesterase
MDTCIPSYYLKFTAVSVKLKCQARLIITMKLGIISDTHDNVENVIKAFKLFSDRQVDRVLHCGDIIAPKTVTFFNGPPVTAVKGNCDGDVPMLAKLLEERGGEHLGDEGLLDLEGQKICIYHGTNPAKLDTFIKSGAYQYVLTGHTHVLRDERVGSTRVLNPGAHYYGADGTVMLLDLSDDKVEVVKL